MTKKIEIYLRHSSGRSLLMFHVPASNRNNFLEGLKRGEVSGNELGINLELSVLPEWITDPTERENFIRSGSNIHIRISLASITASYSEDEDRI